jgi:hypothetical protein
MSRTPPDTRAPGRPARARRARLAAASLVPALAALAAGCLGDRPRDVSLKLTRGGEPVAVEEVELRFENPPGGHIQLRTDGEGRVEVPAVYRGLRFQAGADCPSPGQCRRYYAPSRLDGDAVTVELTGGVNYP